MRAALAAWSLAVAVSAAGAADIWIEAEEPAASNFPPAAENPFAPTAFWEEDALSGGRWIGMFWKMEEGGQPFAEYEFTAEAAGDYALYARKFYTYGNFRWRVDDGPWLEVPAPLHKELDSVSLRDTASEKITVTWHYMGSAHIEPGRHRLRIEPLPGKMPATREGQPPLPGYPLAYDAFLLTTEPFSPAGKLKPGESFEARSLGGFPFHPGRDPFKPSPVDWRKLNEPVAGERGGITVKDGRLVHRKDGGEARLLGVNARPGPNASPASCAYLARLLAKKGVNLARLDIAPLFQAARGEDGQPVLSLEEPMLDLLLRMAADFKAQGIFTALTWDFSNTRGLNELAEFELPEPIETIETSFHVLFSPKIQELIREGWARVLLAKMPGSSEPLSRDPALALVTLGQQLSAFALPGTGQSAVPAAALEWRERAFREWLASRYGSIEAARKAWQEDGGSPPGDGESLLPAITEIAKGGGARARDAARFLAGAERQWLESLARGIRQRTGYPGLLSFSNRPAAFPETLGLPAAWASMGADITERVGIIAAPYTAPENIWVIAAGGRFQDRSVLRFDPLPGLDEARFDLPLKAVSFQGRPAALTEAAWAAPNRFRGEGPLLAALLASMQDVRILAFQGQQAFDWHLSLPNTRLPLLTPATLGQFPAIAFAFRQGLLPGPFAAGKWKVPEDEFFSLRPAAIADMREAAVAPGPPPSAPSGAGRTPASLYLAGKLEVERASGPEQLVVEEEALEGVSAEVMALGGGAVNWDSARGLLQVAAPQFEAVAGFLRQAGPQAAGSLRLRSEMEFGVVCLVALDGKPLDFSSRMLLQVFSEEHNTGEFIEEGPPRVLRSIGRPPLLVTPLQGTVSLDRPDAREILATALDANGYPVLPVGHAQNLQLLPATLYYLLEK